MAYAERVIALCPQGHISAAIELVAAKAISERAMKGQEFPQLAKGYGSNS
jgi:hypothetical protein